jgi:hypothetical protein
LAQHAASNLGSTLEAHYSVQWQLVVRQLFSMLHDAEYAVNDLYDSSIGSLERRRVWLANGMGPWGTYKIRSDVKTSVGKFCHVVLDRLEDMYADYLRPLQLRQRSFQTESTRVFLVHHATEGVHPTEEPQRPGGIDDTFSGDAISLIHSVYQLIAQDGRCEYEDSNASGSLKEVQHVVIVIRTPSTLLQADVDWGVYTNDNGALTAEDIAKSKKMERSNKAKSYRLPTASVKAPSDDTKLRGKHEIIHGEYSSATGGTEGEDEEDKTTKSPERPKTDMISKDETFSELVSALMKWLRYSSSRSVTMYSTGWAEGFNFEIIQNVTSDSANSDAEISSFVRIKHVNLLPTGKAFSCLPDPNAPPRRPVMRYDDEQKKWFRVPVPDPVILPKSAHRILRRVERSMPNDQVEFRLLKGTDKETMAILKYKHACLSADSERTVSPILETEQLPIAPFERNFGKITAPQGTAVALYLENFDRDVSIFGGPSIVNVTASTMVVFVDALGIGFVTATLYEMPLHTKRADALAIIGSSEHENLSPTEEQQLRCNGAKSRLVLTFSNLKSNTCYCLSCKPIDDVPLIVLALTLTSTATDSGNAVSTSLVGAVSTIDEVLPTGIAQRMDSVLEGIRSPGCSVHLIHSRSNKAHKSLTEMPVYLTTSAPGAEYFGRITDRTNFVKLKPEALATILTLPALSTPRISELLQIVATDKFCSLSAKTENPLCLLALTLAVEFIEHTAPNIKNIKIFVLRPLVRHLCKQPNGTWLDEGAAYSSKRLCSELILSLLHWKAQMLGRDSQIFTIIDSQSIKCAVFHLTGDEHAEHGHAHPTLQVLHRHTHAAHAGVMPRRHSHLKSTFNFQGPRRRQQSRHKQRQSKVHHTHDHKPGIAKRRNRPTVRETEHHQLSVEHLHQQPLLAADAAHTNQERKDIPRLGIGIRHIMLPAFATFGHEQDNIDRIVFPKGTCMLGHQLCYDVHSIDVDAARQDGLQTPQNGELHVHLQRPFGVSRIDKETPTQAVAYIVDTVLDSDEVRGLPCLGSVSSPGIDHNGDKVHDLHVEHQHVQLDLMTTETSLSQRGRSTVSSFSSVVVRQYLHDLDLLKVVFGPVIGLVTSNSAIILIELSRPVPFFKCVVRKIGEHHNPGITLQQAVNAYSIATFKFTGLEPNCVYEIYLPVLAAEAGNDDACGFFRTHEANPQYCEIAITGDNNLQDMPILVDGMHQLRNQISVNLHGLNTQGRFIHGANIAFSEEARAVGLLTLRQARNRLYNSWMKLSEQLRHPSMLTNAVFHLGSFSLFAQNISDLAKHLLVLARQLQLPVRDAGAVHAMRFRQLEDCIKDSFRLMLSAPSIQNALCVGSHLPTYTSDLLLPLNQIAQSDIIQDEVDAKNMQVIRKVFEAQYLAYVAPLYALEPDAPHHSRVWRMGSLAVVVLDIVSDRKKAKKKKIAGEDADKPLTEAPKVTKSSSNPFTMGFVEKVQWKLLKDLSMDGSIVQLFICTQLPIVPLQAVPASFTAPEEIAKGDMLEWAPTSSDLDIFFQHWVEWMKPSGTGETPANRSVTFLSQSSVPHTTVIQDMPTGLSMKQLCVGNFNGSADRMSNVRDMRLQDVQLNGKIGTVRYVHRFKNQDNVIVDSARDSLLPELGLDEQFIRQCCSPNYATLRFWFDSWKPSGLWSVTPTEAVEKDKGDACMVLGPVLGAPYLIKVEAKTSEAGLGGQQMMVVPLLLEVDRHSIITIEATHIFRGDVLSWTVEMEANIPRILVIGPLELECRYIVNFTGITAASQYGFSLNTFINWSEANLAVLNCAPSTTTPCSDFIRDLVQHGSVPFSGLTAAVLLNLSPSSTEIEYIHKSSVLRQGLIQLRQTGELVPAFKQFLAGLIHNARQLFRNLLCRPSYRILFKTTYNLFLFQSTEDPHASIQIPEVDDNPKISAMTPDEYNAYLHEREERIAEKAVDDDIHLFVSWLVKMIHMEYLGGLNLYSAAFDGCEADIKAMFLPRGTQLSSRRPQTDGHKELDKQTQRVLDSVLSKWQARVPCQSGESEPWHSPNDLLSVELLPRFDPTDVENVQAMVKSLRQTNNNKLSVGNRVVITHDHSVLHPQSYAYAADPQATESIPNSGIYLSDTFALVQAELIQWVENRADRRLCVICPCTKYGTRHLYGPSGYDNEQPSNPSEEVDNATSTSNPVPLLPIALYLVDSIFRSNEREKERVMMSRALAIRTQVAAYATGKTAKALKKQEEEFKRLMALQSEQVREQFQHVQPDGYVLVESRTSLYETSVAGKTNIISTLRMSMMSSTTQAEIVEGTVSPDVPTIYDYIQFPQWMQWFLPNRDGPFIQDEVFLAFKSQQSFQTVIDRVEGSELVPSIRMLYESSRLSELSRPVDLREVDMSKPGVVEQFTRDLFRQIYRDIVPSPIRSLMMPFSDDMVLSLLLSRTLADTTPLNSPESFAVVVQQCLVLAMAMKHSFNVRDSKRYAFIAKLPDKATVFANKLADRLKRLHTTHQRAKVRNPLSYDAEQVEKEFEELEDAIEELRAVDGGESDMEELVKEEVQAHMLEEREQIQRALEQREKEMEAIENDRLTAEAKGDADTSKADHLAEMRKNRVQFNKLLDAGFTAAFDKLLEEIYARQEEVAIVEQQKEAQLTLTMSQMGGQETDEERNVREAKIQQATLQKVRIELRRLLGARLTYFGVKQT